MGISYDKIEGSDSRHRNPKERAGCASLLSFQWLNPLISVRTRQQLTNRDLYPVMSGDESQEQCEKLSEAWEYERWRYLQQLPTFERHSSEVCNKEAEKDLNEQKTSTKIRTPCLLNALYRITYPYECISIFLLASLRSISLVMVPVFLHFLLRVVMNDSLRNTFWPYALGLGICSCVFVSALVFHHYKFMAGRIGIRWRAALTGLVYKKALLLPDHVGKRDSLCVSQVCNLVINDIHKFQYLLSNLPNILLAPIELVLVFTFLARFADWPTLNGITAVCIILLSQACFGRIKTTIAEKVKPVACSRMSLVRELLEGIRSVKMCAWEDAYSGFVKDIRRQETQLLFRANCITAAVTTLERMLLQPVILLSMIFTLHTLTPFVIFFIGSSILVIKSAANQCLGPGIKQAAECWASLKRIEVFLLKEGSLSSEKETLRCRKSTQNADSDSQEKASMVKEEESPDQTFASSQDVSCLLNESTPELLNICFPLRGSGFCAIVGPEKSGKSSLLGAILHELLVQSGVVSHQGQISYLSQIPWIFSGTIRENIVFNNNFNQKRYDKVIEACELQRDFNVLSDGDLTNVGEHGVILSSCQRSRVNLARAIYTEADTYLVDDSLNTIERSMRDRILKRVINGFLHKRMRIVATRYLQNLQQVDHVIVMSNGQIVKQGTYSEVVTSHLSNNVLASTLGNWDERAQQGVKTTQKEEESYEMGVIQTRSNDASSVAEDADLVTATWSTYWKYYKTAFPLALLMPLTIFIVLALGYHLIIDWWLSGWISVSWAGDEEQRFKVIVFISLSIGAMALVFLAALFLLQTVTASTTKIYNRMTAAVLKAPIMFFERNATETILNHFCGDIAAIEDAFPVNVLNSLTLIVQVFLSVAVPSVANKWIILAALPTVTLCLYYWRPYFKTAREVGCLQVLNRKRRLTHIADTLHGLLQIRAGRAQQKFLDDFFRHQDNLTQCWFASLSLNNWFGLRTDLIAAAFISAVVVGSLLASINAGLVALSVVYALQAHTNILLAAYHHLMVDNVMTSAERVISYAELELEPGSNQQTRPLEHWPKVANINFANVTQAFQISGSSALQNVNFQVKDGQKVGIVGSEKRSIVAALMRMPQSQGQIRVDGVDISDLNLQAWRRRVSVIPCDPVLFTGTLRRNIDPYEQFEDADIWKALETAHATSLVENLDNQLYHKVDQREQGFSLRDRQLMCLSRALLHGNKIIVLEESLTDADDKTDIVIHELLRHMFKECTVLSILQQENTILNYDQVIVLHQGKLVDVDEPATLLAREADYTA